MEIGVDIVMLLTIFTSAIALPFLSTKFGQCRTLSRSRSVESLRVLRLRRSTIASLLGRLVTLRNLRAHSILVIVGSRGM